jgi:hypothetical protein
MERRTVEDDCVCEVRVCGSPLYLRQKDFNECSSPDFTGCTEEEKEEAEAAPSSSSAGATTTTIITSMDKEKEEAPTTYVPSYSPPSPTPYEPTFQCLPLPINRVLSLKRHSSPIKPNYSPTLPPSLVAASLFHGAPLRAQATAWSYIGVAAKEGQGGGGGQGFVAAAAPQAPGSALRDMRCCGRWREMSIEEGGRRTDP